MLKRISVFFNSLRNRVIFSALLMVFILLPLVGITISNAYEKHMIASIKNELSAHSYSILATVEVENNRVVMPELLLENQFNVSQSGLYALLTQPTPLTSAQQPSTFETLTQNALWRSQSMLTLLTPDNLAVPAMGLNQFYQSLLEGKTHFTYSLSVSFNSDEQPFPMTLHILKQHDDLAVLMAEFHQKLFFGLAILMAILLLFQYLWSIWTLKPLSVLQHELSEIEQGSSDSLKAPYPNELIQVTDQVNLLLKSEQKQRQRYRNALSDLAHSLKTPLAVIQSQPSISTLTLEQVNVMNAMIEHQLRKAQSAGQSAWYLGTAFALCLEKLLPSLTKIYRDKSLTFHSDVSPELMFKGDEADLLEILGNLLDNACKAAKANVRVSCIRTQAQCEIVIEDDGCGIATNIREEILQRGTRADTYQQGHGIGLAIVRDLVSSYHGQLVIDDSALLGGAKFTISLPN